MYIDNKYCEIINLATYFKSMEYYLRVILFLRSLKYPFKAPFLKCVLADSSMSV